MALLRHAEFIEKMARYKPISEAWNSNGGLNNHAAFGAVHDMSGLQIWSALGFYKRHQRDPQIPSLGEETHRMVCNLAKVVDLSSPEAMRASLIKECRAEPPDGKLNDTKRGVNNFLLIKVMKASGLKWFELDGTPYIHWCEKA